MRDTLHCDIAFQNVGGIRVDEIPAGKITRKQIFELSPFANTFIIYKLNPKQIKKLIFYAYTLKKRNEIEVSGLNIILKVNKAGKLKKIILKDENGNQLENKLYTVAINDYMAAAYELKFLRIPYKYTDIIDAEAIMNFIQKNTPITYKSVKRVLIK